MIANSESYNHEITTTVNSKVKVLKRLLMIFRLFQEDSENFGKVPMLMFIVPLLLRNDNNKIMKKYHKDTRTFRPQTLDFNINIVYMGNFFKILICVLYFNYWISIV